MNCDELETLIQNIFDDAILIGCDEEDFKKIKILIDDLYFSLGKVLFLKIYISVWF